MRGEKEVHERKQIMREQVIDGSRRVSRTHLCEEGVRTLDYRTKVEQTMGRMVVFEQESKQGR